MSMTAPTSREELLALADRLAAPHMNKSRYEERMLNGDERDLIVAALRGVAQGAVNPDIVEGIAKTIWLAEFSRAFSRTPSDPWGNQAEPVKEGHRNTARKIIEAGYALPSTERAPVTDGSIQEGDVLTYETGDGRGKIIRHTRPTVPRPERGDPK